MLIRNYFNRTSRNLWQLLVFFCLTSASAKGQVEKTSLCQEDGQNQSICGERIRLNLDKREEVVVRNDPIKMAEGDKCASMRVIFARGTTELGNVGLLTGPPFFKALASYIQDTSGLSIQGVDYKADISGFLKGGSPEGAAKMANLITETQEKCPDTYLIVSGYSQGAQLVHKATDQLPASVVGNIGAIVMFGDPNKGDPIKNYDEDKTLTICHRKDLICAGKPIVLPSHLNYAREAKYAAKFVLRSKGIWSDESPMLNNSKPDDDKPNSDTNGLGTLDVDTRRPDNTGSRTTDSNKLDDDNTSRDKSTQAIDSLTDS